MTDLGSHRLGYPTAPAHSPFGEPWAGEKPKHKIPDGSASTELAFIIMPLVSFVFTKLFSRV